MPTAPANAAEKERNMNNNHPFHTNEPDAIYLPACCPGCEDVGKIQTGHFQCNLDAIKAIEAGSTPLEAPQLTAGRGWEQPVTNRK